MSEPTGMDSSSGSDCDRFEQELASFVNGDGVEGARGETDDHELGCDACRRSRSTYLLITEGLANLPSMQPPAGWEARVLERIERRGTQPRVTADVGSTSDDALALDGRELVAELDGEPEIQLVESGARKVRLWDRSEGHRSRGHRSKRHGSEGRRSDGNADRVVAETPRRSEKHYASVAVPRWALLLAAAAAVIGTAALLTKRAPPETRVALNQQIVKTSQGRRADSAVIGDELRIEGSSGGSEPVEVRVYRGEKDLVARCPGDALCKTDQGRTTLTVPLSVKGSYRSLLIVGSSATSTGTLGFDADARAAHEAGARVELSLPIEVE